MYGHNWKQEKWLKLCFVLKKIGNQTFSLTKIQIGSSSVMNIPCQFFCTIPCQICSVSHIYTVPVQSLYTPTQSRVFLYFYYFLHCIIIIAKTSKLWHFDQFNTFLLTTWFHMCYFIVLVYSLLFYNVDNYNTFRKTFEWVGVSKLDSFRILFYNSFTWHNLVRNSPLYLKDYYWLVCQCLALKTKD
jgi:hypothetical protein